MNEGRVVVDCIVNPMLMNVAMWMIVVVTGYSIISIICGWIARYLSHRKWKDME